MITVAGYVETYYQLSVQDPSNRITNLRGYDNRSRTFTIENAVLDMKGEAGPITTRVALQVGHTGATYYLGEPLSMGTSSVDTSDGDLWKYLQVATISAKLPDEWLLEGGLFLSPIGIEVIPIKDNINWSRSNLAFSLPTYHTGAVLGRTLGDGWTGKLYITNGWNSVVDNNGSPSVAAAVAYAGEQTTAQLLYFGGNQRPSGAPEGFAWRNLFDAYAQYAVNDVLTIAAQGDAGFEPNDFGTSWWAAIAGYARYAFNDELYVAVRGDFFFQDDAEDAAGASAAPIFFPSQWVAEGTATVAYQPADYISVRLEYRHDQADSDVYFGGDVAIDPVTEAFIPDRDSQDTVLVGATAWF